MPVFFPERKRFFLSVSLLLAVMAYQAHALDFSARLRPYLSFPIGNADTDKETGFELYTLGFGADAVFDVDISSILSNPLFLGYSVGPVFSYNIVPVKSTDTMIQMMGGGAEASLFYFFNRVSLRAGLGMGLYSATFENKTSANIWYSYGAEAGFRFSPNFVLSAFGGFRQNNYEKGNPLYSGIVAGLSVQFSFETGKQGDDITISFSQDEPVFPVFSTLYQTNQVGELRITNHEATEITNVNVYFRAGGYTSAQLYCGTIPKIGKRRTASVPLLANFSSALFDLSENSQIPGEVVIQYRVLGQERSVTRQALVSVYNRNSFRWSDISSLAVFVSQNDPEVLDYSKYIIGVARNHLRTGLNQNMQYAVFLFEGLRAGNMNYFVDRITPYDEFHKDSSLVDNVQFPFQTLAHRGGDVDEIGLLYAATLESVGISAALIPVDNDFLVAFSLDITAEQAGNFFDGTDSLLILDGKAWLPVSMSTLKEGFINSWFNAVNLLDAIFQSGDAAEVVILQDAWVQYPSAAITSERSGFEKPSEEEIFRVTETAMLRYIASEFGPKIRTLQNEIRQSGPSVERYNRLGLLYVRSGMFNEARAEYQRSAAMGSATAMVNLGNLSLLGRDYAAAEQWFRRALQEDPGNRPAQNGLRQIIEREME